MKRKKIKEEVVKIYLWSKVSLFLHNLCRELMVRNFLPAGSHWAKMGLIFPRTPFPSGNSIYSKVKQIASFEK